MIYKAYYRSVPEEMSFSEKLADIEIDESLTDSNTCLIDMSALDEEEEDTLTMEIDFKEIEKDLEHRRKIKIAIISLIFIMTIGFITYSVISDLKTQRGKLKIVVNKTKTSY